MNPLGAFDGKKSSVDVVSASYNWAPTVRQDSER